MQNYVGMAKQKRQCLFYVSPQGDENGNWSNHYW